MKAINNCHVCHDKAAPKRGEGQQHLRYRGNRVTRKMVTALVVDVVDVLGGGGG